MSGKVTHVYIKPNINNVMRIMVTDISDNLIQSILSVLNIAFIYISKMGMWIGLMVTTDRASKAILYKDKKRNGAAISKGIGIIFISLILYILIA